MFLQLALDQLARNLPLIRHVPRRREKNPHYRRLLAARLPRGLSPLLRHPLVSPRTRNGNLPDRSAEAQLPVAASRPKRWGAAFTSVNPSIVDRNLSAFG